MQCSVSLEGLGPGSALESQMQVRQEVKTATSGPPPLPQVGLWFENSHWSRVFLSTAGGSTS